MKLLWRMAAVTALSLGIAGALSFLPEADSVLKRRGGEMTVFGSARPVELGADNLVDWIVGVPVRLELAKADWQHRILALDYVLPDSAAPEDAYAQLRDAVVMGLAGTTNVERVMIRVYDIRTKDRSKQRLLLALDAERKEMNDEIADPAKNRKQSAERWLEERFELRKSARWKEWESRHRKNAKQGEL